MAIATQNGIGFTESWDAALSAIGKANAAAALLVIISVMMFVIM